MKAPSHTKLKTPWLLNPWVVLSSVLIGAGIGIYQPELGIKMAPIGDIYLALLEMCVLPILVSAIISGLGRLLGSKTRPIRLSRLFLVFIAGLMLASAVGIASGLLLEPGSGLDQEARAVLGRQLESVERLESSTVTITRPTIGALIMDIVPRNIVAAISQGPSLAVLFFAIVFGCALGLLRTPAAEMALTFVEGVYGAFLKIIFWILYGLPIGLIGLFAGQISRMGPDIMWVLMDLVLACALSAVVLLIIYSIAIWRAVGGPFLATLLVFKQTFVIALTASAFATIPSALHALHSGLKIPRSTADLVFPLGINLNRHGSVFQFALAAVFMAQLYSVPLDAQSLTTIWIGAIFAGMAALGGLPGLGMLALVLQFLGLPSEVAIILLTSVDSLMVPMLVLVSVYANCALTVLSCKKRCTGTPDEDLQE